MNNMSVQDITPVVLAGGQGTRLRSVTGALPKVLAPVSGSGGSGVPDRPFLACVLDRLAEAGFVRCIISTGYKARAVQQAFGVQHGTMELIFVPEASPLGTAGAVRLAVEAVHTETVMVLNGDSLFGCPYREFVQGHNACGLGASLLGVWVDDVSRYGQLRIADGRVLAFAEKAGSGPGYINGGIYFLAVQTLRALRKGQKSSMEYDLLPEIIHNKGKQSALGAICTTAPFLDIGTPASYAEAAAFVRQFCMPA